MSSYVLIDFDRTAPSIEIYAPRYTTNEIVNVITVEANEPLSTYQEFYAIDTEGNKHTYTFFQESETTYIGKVKFNSVPEGILTFHARVRDTVDNTSSLISKTIDVKGAQLLKLEISDTARLMEINDSRHKEEITVRTRPIEILDEGSNLEERGH